MAWHNDGARVPAHRLADAARVRLAELRRDGPVGEGRAGPDGTRHRVDAAVELRHAFEVEHDVSEIAALAGNQRYHAADRPRDLVRRGGLACARVAPHEPRPHCGIVAFRQQHADDATLAPHDRAAANGGVEQVEALRRH